MKLVSTNGGVAGDPVVSGSPCGLKAPHGLELYNVGPGLCGRQLTDANTTVFGIPVLQDNWMVRLQNSRGLIGDQVVLCKRLLLIGGGDCSFIQRVKLI